MWQILEETKFQPREFPRSGSKAMDVEERRERERRTAKVSDYNGQYLTPEPISDTWTNNFCQSRWFIMNIIGHPVKIHSKEPVTFTFFKFNVTVKLLCLLPLSGYIKAKHSNNYPVSTVSMRQTFKQTFVM